MANTPHDEEASMRTTARRAAGTVALAGGAVLLRPGTRANKWMRRRIEAANRRLRHVSGRLKGVSYRLRGRRPDPDVIDNVLADRIRSSLGGLEKQLDLPHVHVMVEDHVALLHGEVSSDVDADQLEKSVAAVSGVVGVESYLHVGLAGGDTRPSEGRAVHPPSGALRLLLDAAVGAGIAPDSARPVVRGILATFADRLPAGEREQVSAHLPADVRPLFTPPRRAQRARPPRTVHQLVARIAAVTGELPHDKAEQVTAAVVETLRGLVPEEAGDVGAVLPQELRALWQGGATP
jgi:uncharacterized protein (DUF2267 family)/osmotically-inducible protein OsmY